MSFDSRDIWLIVAIVAVVAIVIPCFAIFILRKRKGLKPFGRPFLVIGLIWLLAGLSYGFWRKVSIFNNVLFNLGLIITLGGVCQLLIDRFLENRS